MKTTFHLKRSNNPTITSTTSRTPFYRGKRLCVRWAGDIYPLLGDAVPFILIDQPLPNRSDKGQAD